MDREHWYDAWPVCIQLKIVRTMHLIPLSIKKEGLA